jgi:hypothetical protein
MGADSRELVHVAAPPMSVESIRERSVHVQALVKSLMVEGVHFMTIPGTDGKSLTKQGTEMLLSAFHISVEPMIEDKSDADAVRFTVKITGTHMGSGIVVGVGVGRCSSNEEKYKWRRAVCREEWDATPESRRRIAWKTGSKGAYSINQVRTNPEDLANTVLKMAKKRAQADLCLTALAASDAFRPQARPPNGDPTLEQLRAQTRARPESSAAAETKAPVSETKRPDPETRPPSGATNAPRPATSSQLGLIKRKLDQSGIPENHFLAQFEINRLEELPFAQVDAALKWLADLDQGPP